MAEGECNIRTATGCRGQSGVFDMKERESRSAVINEATLKFRRHTTSGAINILSYLLTPLECNSEIKLDGFDKS